MEKCLGQSRYCLTYKEFVPLEAEISPEFIRNYDYAGNIIVHRLEYIYNFIRHGWRALKKKELLLRIKLRIQRMKSVNKRCMEAH